MSFTAQGRISASLTVERGSLHQTGERNVVARVLAGWDLLFLQGVPVQRQKKKN